MKAILKKIFPLTVLLALLVLVVSLLPKEGVVEKSISYKAAQHQTKLL